MLNLFAVVLGVCLILYGLLGLLTGRITLATSAGLVRWSGARAYAAAAIVIFFGVVFVLQVYLGIADQPTGRWRLLN